MLLVGVQDGVGDREHFSLYHSGNTELASSKGLFVLEATTFSTLV